MKLKVVQEQTVVYTVEKAELKRALFGRDVMKGEKKLVFVLEMKMSHVIWSEFPDFLDQFPRKNHPPFQQLYFPTMLVMVGCSGVSVWNLAVVNLEGLETLAWKESLVSLQMLVIILISFGMN